MFSEMGVLIGVICKGGCSTACRRDMLVMTWRHKLQVCDDGYMTTVTYWHKEKRSKV